MSFCASMVCLKHKFLKVELLGQSYFFFKINYLLFAMPKFFELIKLDFTLAFLFFLICLISFSIFYFYFILKIFNVFSFFSFSIFKI